MILIQSLSASAIGQKKHYLNVPDEVLSWIRINNIYKGWHILPSSVVSILMGIKIYPLLSEDYAKQLEINGTAIPLAICITLFPVMVINGIIIEKILVKRNL